MKSLIIRIAAYIGFLACLTTQIYLGLMLTPSNIWAQSEAVKEPVKKEAPAVNVVGAEKKAKASENQDQAAGKLEEVAKKFRLPFKNFKLDDNSLKFTVGDGSGKEEKINIDFNELGEKSTNVRGERSIWHGLESIVVPLAFFLLIFFMIKQNQDSRLKMKREQMETIKLMVEKGQPIPTGIFYSEEKGTWLSLMQRGLKMTAIGLGLALFFFTVDGPWALGAIPFFIGIGQIISAKIRQKHEQK